MHYSFHPSFSSHPFHSGSSSQSNIEKENIYTLFLLKPSYFCISAPTIDKVMN
jgi:hypothetical protein